MGEHPHPIDTTGERRLTLCLGEVVTRLIQPAGPRQQKRHPAVDVCEIALVTTFGGGHGTWSKLHCPQNGQQGIQIVKATHCGRR